MSPPDQPRFIREGEQIPTWDDPKALRAMKPGDVLHGPMERSTEKVEVLPAPPRPALFRALTFREVVRALLAFWIISIAAHDAIRHGKIEDSLLVLVGAVIGYYFKDAPAPCKDSHASSEDPH
jgi:hypothetical protein